MVADRIQGIRGMNDVLPPQSVVWRDLEQRFAQCLSHYGYSEIRMPFLESTALFKRTIGEITDIVEKEMYTFDDLNGDSLTLRPEGTAGCVRACLEHGLLHNQQQKLWYSGPMFRHERPQKGRYRQFNQFGVEVFGIAGVGIELELLAICQRLWVELGFSEKVHLQINTLGSFSERQTYREQLVAYLKQHRASLDEDSQRRLDRNPLRILDSKNPNLASVIENAPKLLEVMSDESRDHFNELCEGLKVLNIAYTVNPTLVRGLDYYGHTVFEWVTDQLGSQATICAGGRFDQLVEQLGGRPTPAIGFAMGLERLILLRETLNLAPLVDSSPSVFMIATDKKAVYHALHLAEILRNKPPHWRVCVNTDLSSLKSQFKKADKSGARLALILGEDEIKNKAISLKDLRKTTEQVTIPQSQLGDYINNYLQ